MAQLQYIGARYVPVWYHNSVDDTANWEVNVEYEPLTFVTSLNNHLYLSKKTVPDNIGTPADNTDYWLDMGAFSGGANLQEQIDDIVANMGDLDDLTTTDKTSLVNAINEVAENVPTERAKKYVIITDSYGNRQDTDGNTVGQLLTSLGKDIKFYLAVSGGGFIKTGNEALQSHLYDYTGDHDEITDVVFMCSANDNAGTTNDIQSATITAINAAKAAYPNAKISIVPWGVAFVNESWALVLSDITVKAYQLACDYTGAILAKNAQYMLRNTVLLDNDHIHPNASGVSYLAAQVNGFLDGNTIDVMHEIDAVFTFTASGLSNASANNLKMYRHNGDVVISADYAGGIFGQFDFAYAANPSWNPLCKISNTLYSRPQADSHKYMNARGRARIDATLYPANALGYEGCNLSFSIYGLDNDIRVFCNCDQYYEVNRIMGLQNTVTISD